MDSLRGSCVYLINYIHRSDQSQAALASPLVLPALLAPFLALLTLFVLLVLLVLLVLVLVLLLLLA